MFGLSSYSPRRQISRSPSIYSQDRVLTDSRAQAEYEEVDIGGTLDMNAVTELVRRAAAMLPPSQAGIAQGNWGFYIQVHTGDRTVEAVIVKPYPYKSWGW